MKKSERIRHLIEELGSPAAEGLDGRYVGFFTCFNRGEYYEAHDVLEDLWLEEEGEEANFYQGLIQLAGAFVHLRKQAARPDHPKDGRRLRPAVRLFALAERNLAPYGPVHRRLDVAGVLALASAVVMEIVRSDFTSNPWHPEHAPKIELH